MMRVAFFVLALATPAASMAAPSAAAVPNASSSGMTPDPARLAIARDIAGRVLPNGTFEKLMATTMGGMMKPMTDGMLNLPLKSLVGMGGIDEAKLKGMGPGTMRQMMMIVDPAFEQRMQIMTGVMGTEMGHFMATMEPSFREGLAEAYANRFDPAELADINIFFKSPAGTKFASQIMTVQTDPAFMGRMQQMIPRLMQAMPDIMKKVEAATANLPKAKKAADLTAEDKAEINKLMGIDPAKVK